ncbi:MAG: trimethylamine methyltransferase family protein [Anaerolineales bacterium]|jgi:trimethylamine--corrinoid protein Co-methyltransferase
MNPWQVLSKQDIDSIHQATLRVLSEVGIGLSHPQVRDLLQDMGASVIKDRVLLPSELVEKAISSCGKKITTMGRSAEEIVLGDGTLHWHNLGGAREVYDPVSAQPRPANLQDIRDSTRLLDALDQATTITPFFTPQDVPGELMSLAMYRFALPHTTKPLQGPGVQVPQEVRYLVLMAEVIGPVEKVLTMSVSPVSPLSFPTKLVESMVQIAHYGIPFGPLPCPTAGTTAPFSLAGALTQQNAEILACIVIVQQVNPGLPVIYCGRLAMMEPRSGSSIWGGVELGIASAATVQMGHHYGLPVNVYGLSTNAHTLDLQSGYERALNAILPALAGADELSGIGEMEAGVMGSYAQMVCDNEIAASVRRVLKGFAVNEDSLAVHVIQKVMHTSRNFLTDQHSIKYLRSGEIMLSKVADRRTFAEWDRTGRNGMAENAQAEAERLLKEHEVPPLTDDQETELERIWGAAKDDLIKFID